MVGGRGRGSSKSCNWSRMDPDLTPEAVHPYIEACAVEMRLWEQMEKVEGTYVGIPENIHRFDLLGGSFRNHIR